MLRRRSRPWSTYCGWSLQEPEAEKSAAVFVKFSRGGSARVAIERDNRRSHNAKAVKPMKVGLAS